MQIIKLNLKQATDAELTRLIDQAIAVIKNGGLVIYPTETTYGIGANPHSTPAIDKLLQYKSRRKIAQATSPMAWPSSRICRAN